MFFHLKWEGDAGVVKCNACEGETTNKTLSKIGSVKDTPDHFCPYRLKGKINNTQIALSNRPNK